MVNVATWLVAREWGGNSKRRAAQNRLFTTPPPRLQLPVESLGSDTNTTHLLKQVVILGFTRCASMHTLRCVSCRTTCLFVLS